MEKKNKPFEHKLDSILVFGASGHVASAMVDTIIEQSPETKLRLATSSKNKIQGLKIKYPQAEVVECNYLNREQMEQAFAGMEGVYIITPDFIDMTTAMNNVVHAADKAGTIRHVVRVHGDAEEDISHLLSEYLRTHEGTSTGHPIARKILDASSLNITYTNVAGYFMDNLSNHYFGGPIKSRNTLIDCVKHPMLYVDEKEIGEAGARILMRRNPEDIGAYIHLNSQEPARDLSEVAELLTKVLGRDIAYLEDKDEWMNTCGKAIDAIKKEGAGEYQYHNFLQEVKLFPIELLAMVQQVSRLGEILGRTPNTLESWMTQNKSAFDMV